MNKKELKTYNDLVSWTDLPDYCGIAVFENTKTKKRIALMLSEIYWNIYVVGQTTLPYSAQPNDSWSYAPLIAKTKDINEAMEMIFKK